MNKKTSIFAAAMVLSAALCSCGSNNTTSEEDRKNSQSSVAEENSDNQSSVETTSNEAEEVTETSEEVTENSEEEELYGFYDLLIDEYNDGDYHKCFTTGFDDGKVYIYVGEPINGYTDYICYDTEKKETKTILSNSDVKRNPPVYSDGYVYAAIYETGTIEKYDTDGNMLASYTVNGEAYGEKKPSIEDIYVTENGTVYFIYRASYLGTPHYFILTPDFKTATEIEGPAVTVAHDEKKVVKIERIVGDYDNILYVATSTLPAVFGLDLDTMEWTPKESFDIIKDNYEIKNIGKYVFITNGVYDIVADEKIAETQFNVLPASYGGNGYSYVQNEGNWVEIKIPSEKRAVDYADGTILGTAPKKVVTVLNDTYYLLSDDYGYFLHTFEKGEDEEETIYKYNK